jgi:predicted HicB family RNase H-like nuclease
MLNDAADVDTIARPAERSSPNTRAGNGRLVFKVTTELHKACDTEAHRRHMTLNALLRLLLTRIVRDKLFDAVIGK